MIDEEEELKKLVTAIVKLCDGKSVDMSMRALGVSTGVILSTPGLNRRIRELGARILVATVRAVVAGEFDKERLATKH
jgi:hypothetical protein